MNIKEIEHIIQVLYHCPVGLLVELICEGVNKKMDKEQFRAFISNSPGLPSGMYYFERYEEKDRKVLISTILSNFLGHHCCRICFRTPECVCMSCNKNLSKSIYMNAIITPATFHGPTRQQVDEYNAGKVKVEPIENEMWEVTLRKEDV